MTAVGFHKLQLQHADEKSINAFYQKFLFKNVISHLFQLYSAFNTKNIMI